MSGITVYLRTKLSIEFETPAIERLAELFPHSLCKSDLVPREFANDPEDVSVFGFGPGFTTWEDGVIIDFWSSQSPRVLVDAMGEALRGFDAWAVFNDTGEFVEYPSGGLVGHFFATKEQSKYSTIYLLARESDRKYQSHVDDLRSRMRGKTTPIFHFRDGQVMTYRTDEPARITAQRHAEELARFEYWAIGGDNGGQSSDGGDVWDRSFLSELSYDKEGSD